jgi:hypothetical protein
MKNPPRFQLIALPLWVALIRVAIASPADYVYTPSIEQGEREIDVKYGSATPIAGNSAQAVSLGLGYGATEYWFSEVYLKRERNGAQNVTLTEWENKFQLTETGKYPIDLGLIAELEAPLSGRAPWAFRLGPLFQTESGKFQLNGNLLFDRAFGMRDESGVPFSTNIGYQWQVKYRWQPTLEYGMQGMGEMGKWDSWYKQAEQNHRIGPAVFGKFALGNRQAIKYNAAWLMGLSPAAPNHTFRMQVEYEF